MKKYFKLFIVALAVAVILPQVAMAAWWNPFSWKVWDRVFKTQLQELRQEQTQKLVVFSDNCESINSQINKLVEDFNYCLVDSDCIVSQEIAKTCLCHSLINKNASTPQVKEGQNKYRKLKCPAYSCEVCGPIPSQEDVKCVNKKCVSVYDGVKFEFNSSACDTADEDPKNYIKESKWENNVLTVTAHVVINCANKIEKGDYRIDNNKLFLKFNNIGDDSAKCTCAHTLTFKFSGLKEKDYIIDLSSKIVKNSNQLNQDKTAGWKTYKNTEYGYQIKYPSDWSYSFSNYALTIYCDYSKRSTCQGLGDKNPNTAGYVSIKVDKTSLEDLKKDWIIEKQEDYLLDGIKGERFIGSVATDNGEAYLDLIFAIKDNNNYQISAATITPILTKIISTFKFTK